MGGECGAIRDSEDDSVFWSVRCELDPHGAEMDHEALGYTPSGVVRHIWPVSPEEVDG